MTYETYEELKQRITERRSYGRRTPARGARCGVLARSEEELAALRCW